MKHLSTKQDDMNKIFFIVISQGLGGISHGEESLRIISEPTLFITDDLPLRKKLYASIGFNINVEDIETFTLKVVSPNNDVVKESSLLHHVNKAKEEAEEEGDEVSTLMGIVGHSFGIIKFDIEGEYIVSIHWNDIEIGRTSLFIDEYGSDDDE